MHKIIFVYFMTLFIFLAIPCYSQNANYFPIHVGDTWYYDHPTPQSNPWAMKTIRDSLRIDDLTYYTWTYGDGVDISDTVRADTSGNIWKYSKGNDYLWFDFSKDNGAEYPFELPRPFGSETYYFDVFVETNISVETPAGVFANCIGLFFDISHVVDEDVFYIFAPNIGLVFERDNGWSTQNLTSAVIDGNQITSIKVKTEVPNELLLFQNYPNPFNPETTITYSLPISGFVVLKIFNLAGQKIETLVEELQASGDHQVKWIAQGLPSGIYVYQLQTGEFSVTKKLLLQK